ncbi:hypothetical protein BJ165DRAFT_1410044 [Panaeolus papilionaceus]|nr:hypothetical protein BJ165DRAFT_1410044 [Panaeolus papilionaceus]
MTELTIHLADLDLDMSVFFEGNGEVLIACNDAEANHDDMDVDIDEDDCGCGENQMSHYDYDGSVLDNLLEKCRWNVNGPIGTGELTAEPKNDVEPENESEEPPPPNQQANGVVEVKKPQE